MAIEAVKYHIIKDSELEKYFHCPFSGSQTELTNQILRPNPLNIECQSWLFIPVFNQPNKYLIRNENNVYLSSVGNLIVGSTNKTVWVLNNIQGDTFQIKLDNTNSYIHTNSEDILELSINRSNYDIVISNEIPIEIR